jgi:hypothetical protein
MKELVLVVHCAFAVERTLDADVLPRPRLGPKHGVRVRVWRGVLLMANIEAPRGLHHVLRRVVVRGPLDVERRGVVGLTNQKKALLLVLLLVQGI